MANLWTLLNNLIWIFEKKSLLTGYSTASGIFLSRRFFWNQIFYSSFVWVGPAKLTHPTWHPWVDPVGGNSNLKVRNQQILSPLRTKKHHFPCRQATTLIWRNNLEDLFFNLYFWHAWALRIFLKAKELKLASFYSKVTKIDANLTQMHSQFYIEF